MKSDSKKVWAQVGKGRRGGLGKVKGSGRLAGGDIWLPPQAEAQGALVGAMGAVQWEEREPWARETTPTTSHWLSSPATPKPPSGNGSIFRGQT